MKNIDEKEKKLKDALHKLRKLNILDNKQIEEVDILREQKNQLEIEKNQINKILQNIEKENIELKGQINELEKDYEASKRKEKQFTQKIDELNQETDSLLDEIDKWQM